MRKVSLSKCPGKLATKRLLLRTPSQRDAMAANRAVRESVRELKPWMPWAKRCPTISDTRKFCRAAATSFAARKEFHFYLFTKHDSTLIGCASLVRGDSSVPKFEIGYWIHTQHTRMGYATETVLALTRFARRHLGVRRLEIRMDARNLRSAQVAQRTGYRLEGTLRSDARDNRGRLRDTLVFAKVF